MGRWPLALGRMPAELGPRRAACPCTATAACVAPCARAQQPKTEGRVTWYAITLALTLTAIALEWRDTRKRKTNGDPDQP
jgi:hypothetical protein